MKIAVLGTRGFPNIQGGVETHCENIYPELFKLGCEIVVFTRKPYLSTPKLKEWKNIKFIGLWCPKKKAFEAIIHTLYGLLKCIKLRPDIVHIHSIGPSLLVPLAKILGFKVVMTHHGADYLRQKWGKAAKIILKLGELAGVYFADEIIAISKVTVSEILKKYKKQVNFIPNGVKISENKIDENYIQKFDLKTKKYIFTACRFVPEKGLTDLIKAYNLLKNPEFKLVIAGDADHETKYSKQIKTISSQNKNIILTGMIKGNDLEQLFFNAGLFVLPSYHEGLPIALLEALSYGLPVLVSDIEQHKVVEISKNRYFELGNIVQLSEKIEKLYCEGINEVEKDLNFELLKNFYNWKNISKEILLVYKKILSDKKNIE